MFLPLLLLIVPATVCAAVVAYGTEPSWAQFHHGLSFIIWSRRLQWPLVTLCLLLCVAMIGLVIARPRRLWLLVGLAPVLALFAHRFSPARATMSVEENPAFVDAAAAGNLVHDDDYVVGFSLGEQWFAYPYAVLFRHPVVITADREKRVALIWSAFANRAVATNVAHDLRGRDLEIVSTPQNSLLLYNARNGEFINGVTGLTSSGQKPAGFVSLLPVSKMPWGLWKQAHPATKVMAPPVHEFGPTQPIKPTSPAIASVADAPAGDLRIVLLGNVQPVAISETEGMKQPLNLTVDGVPVLVFRDASGLHALDRRLPNDLTPRFKLNTGKKHPGAMFIDADTDSGWSAEGKWLDGFKELKGKKLQPVPMEHDLYWGVMKYWYPQLQLTPADSK